MDIATIKEFKQRLTDFDERLTQKEKDHQAYLEHSPGLDDLGKAREALSDIMQRTPEEHEEYVWDKEKDGLKRDLASLIILISQ